MMDTLLFFYTMAFSVKCIRSGVPKYPVCLDVNQIAWRSSKPYLVEKHGSFSGIFPPVFKKALRSCCRGELKLNYSIEFKTDHEIFHISANGSMDFVMPVRRKANSKKYFQYPFVSVVESPGIAFFIAPSKSIGEMVVNIILSTGPLLAIMGMLAGIFGTVFWIMEEKAVRLDKVKTSFHKGVWEGFKGAWDGFWWAFVSMTTVGYGDIFPKTNPGKMLSVLWVLVGIIFCSFYTSYVTTILTSACLHQDVDIHGTAIGVIEGSEEHRFALKKNGIPVGHENVEDLADSIRKNEITGLLIESYLAAEYQHLFLPFTLHSIIEQVSSSGIVFQNNGIRFAGCFRDYILSRQGEVIEQIAESVQPLHMSHISAAQEQASSLFNPKSSTFYVTILIILAVLAIFFIFGFMKDRIRLKRSEEGRKDEKSKEANRPMTLTQWRRDYKRELNDMLKSMKYDTYAIKRKSDMILNKLEGSTTHIAGSDCA